MPDEDVVVRLRRIFEEALNMPPPTPETNIIEAGLLDSLALVTLLFEIEREFGLEIPLESLEIEDFSSIDSIALLLANSVSTP
jgi:acyl carrier protein